MLPCNYGGNDTVIGSCRRTRWCRDTDGRTDGGCRSIRWTRLSLRWISVGISISISIDIDIFVGVGVRDLAFGGDCEGKNVTSLSRKEGKKKGGGDTHPKADGPSDTAGSTRRCRAT